MIAYIFPGQGSQKKGMGDGLFDEFKEFIEKADNILGYSIRELCLFDPNNQLNQTQYTQPAIFVINALSYLKKISHGKGPDFVAGHSLGEYSALFASGAFGFESGLKLVQKRGELMSRANGGAMAAIIGLNPEKARKILNENALGNVEIANYNSPTQIVISGSKADIDCANQVFGAIKSVLYIPLRVSGAFHSRYMAEARNEFKKFLEQFKFSKLSIPVISNAYAKEYNNSNIKENLSEQITNPVRWTDIIHYLISKGVNKFEEIGPGKVLTKLINQISKDKGEIENKKDQEELVNHASISRIPPKESKQSELIEGITIVDKKTSEAIIKGKSYNITADSLGNEEYKKDYNLKYSYAAGGMYKGIASKELVVRMGKAGLMSYFGAGGLDLNQIEEAIFYIQKELKNGEPYGINLLYSPLESETVDLLLKYGVKNIEAAAYIQPTASLVKYRIKGLHKNGNGTIEVVNKIQAKVSRPEVAQLFLSPPPENIVKGLLNTHEVTEDETELSKEIPMADDLCVEADSGGHTDQGVAYALMPAIIKLRDELMEGYKYPKKVRVGAAGGIGTPAAAAAAFILGADFILTGSINQCTVEAGTSQPVKDLLQQINVQDTDYAPAGDTFETGAKIQVVKKGLFFAARANKLYETYRQYNSLEEIEEKTKKQIQEKYFKRSFEEIYEEIKDFYPIQEIEKAERNPKHKMALVFKWYFGRGTYLALNANGELKVDSQIMSGPSLGSFNQWVKGTELEAWGKRHVDEIAKKLMIETAEFLNNWFISIKT